jgi:hypothetical protein
MNRTPFRLSFLVIAAFAATGLAHAGNDNCNNRCGSSEQTTYNQGGQGGHGGSGGSAAAIAGAASSSTAVSGAAAGAAVVGSGNSSLENSIKNSNSQSQGQLQGQQQANISRNANTAAGGNAQASVGGNNNTVGGTQTNQGVTVDARNQSVYQAQERDPVNSAYAPSLAASNGTCMGSSSFGATGPGFSASMGSTWKDSDCSIRYTAEALRASGNNAIAQALLCQIPEVAKVAPKHCRAVTTALADPVAAMDQKVGQIAAQTSGTSTGANMADPYIAARLGK